MHVLYVLQFHLSIFKFQNLPSKTSKIDQLNMNMVDNGRDEYDGRSTKSLALWMNVSFPSLKRR